MPPSPRWRTGRITAAPIDLPECPADDDPGGLIIDSDDEDDADDDDVPTIIEPTEDDGLSEWALNEETNVITVNEYCEPERRRKTRRLSGPLSLDCWMMRCPAVLVLIMLLLGSYSFELDSLEIFSGCQSATRALRAVGLNCAVYDLNLGGSPCYDITTSLGFAKVLDLLRRVRPGGLLLGGPPCSSFVWINRSTSGRSEFRPEGRTSLEYIRLANLICCRVMLLLAFCASRGIHWLIEQPGSSILSSMHRFNLMKHNQSVYYTKTWMGMFSPHRTPKSTKLWCNHSWVGGLHRTLDASVCAKGDHDGLALCIKGDDGSVSGGPGLKGSQAWPEGFGEAVAELYLHHKGTQKLDDAAKWRDYTLWDEWADARLDEVTAMLTGTAPEWPSLP